MEAQTIIRIVDIVPLSQLNKRFAIAEILHGGPLTGMTFSSPDHPGRWQFLGFGTIPVEYAQAHPDRMVLEIVNLDEGCEAVAGATLVLSQ